MISKVDSVAWLGGAIDQKKVVWRGRPKIYNRNINDGEMSQKEVRVRTSNDHEIDTFSLGEDVRKDANVGMDSQNNVGFVLCVGWKTLGTGEFYCVLASHPSRVRGLKLWGEPYRAFCGNRTLRGCAD